jgi:ADP-ribose pyrophosphatase
VRVLASERIHRGPVFDLIHEQIRLPSGLEQDLTLVDHGGAVAIAPLDAEGRLVLVRQYRHARGDWTLELPAGRLKPGEEPLAAARRELEEETGLAADRWEALRPILPAPGFCSEIIHLFLARDLHEVPGGGLPCDADEEITLEHRTPADCLGPEIEDAKTLIAALLLLQFPAETLHQQ